MSLTANVVVMNPQGGAIALMADRPESFMISRSEVMRGPEPDLLCIRALLINSKNLIAEKCEFKVAHRMPRVMNIQLSRDHFLVNGYADLRIVSPEETRFVANCTPCVIKVPCGAQLSVSDENLIPPRLDCINDSAVADVIYPVNKAVLDAFYDDFNESDADLFPSTPSILPELNLTAFNTEAAGRTASDQTISYSMKKLASALQNDSVILHTPAEALIYNFVHAERSAGWWDCFTWSNLVITLLFVIICLNSVYVLRMRYQLTALTLAFSARQVKALAIRTPMPVTTTASAFDALVKRIQEVNIEEYHLMHVTICLVIWLVVLTVLHFRSQKRQTAFFLAFDNPASTFELFICKLPSPTRDFAITVTAPVGISLKYFCLFGVLCIESEHIVIKHQLTGTVTRVPRYILLNPIMARSLLLASVLNVCPFVVHSHEYEFLSSPMALTFQSRSAYV